MEEIGRGAEAIILKEENIIIKRRIKKSYRIPEIDEKLRKSRTRIEARIMEKARKAVSIPKIIKADEENKEVIMEFISGKKLSEHLDSFNLEKQKEICKAIGKEVSKLHNLNIVHADLTTSNMILKENKVYLIDFGLGFSTRRIEDKAVDLHLFKQALESKHFSHYKELFEAFLDSYSPNEREKILEQLKKVESRGRYKH